MSKEIEKLNNLSEFEISREEEPKKDIISYEEFKTISMKALDKYQKNPNIVNLNCNPEVIEKIIESFPTTEETKNLYKEIFEEKSLEDKVNLLIKDITQEDFQALKKTTKELIDIITEEGFEKQRREDFSREDSDLIRHFWLTPLHELKGIIDFIEEKRKK